jgi:hypothetical protein
MLSDATKLPFIEAHSDVDNSKIKYRVHILPSDKTEVEAQGPRLTDKEKWEELPSRIEPLVAKHSGASSRLLSNEERLPVHAITKHLKIYTSEKKSPKSAVEIVFTITPTGLSPGGKSWPAIVWKRFQFQPSSAFDLHWYSEAGFCVVDEQADGTLKPVEEQDDGTPKPVAVVVKPKHIAVLQDIEGSPVFSAQLEMQLNTTDIAVINKFPHTRRFALCSFDPTMPQTDQFSPVIDIGSIKSDEILLCGPPVMLQAYVVRGCTLEQKPIERRSISRPLFVDKAGKPKPIDITTLRETTTFCLYFQDAKIILEEDKSTFI